MTTLTEKQSRLTPILSRIIPFIGLIAIVIFFQIMSDGKLLSFRNMNSLINEIFTILIGASGVAFLMAQNCIDFSLGANVAISCAFAANAANIHPYLALPVAVISGLLVGAFNGILNAKFNVMSFLATLAMSFILKGLVISILGSGSIGVPFIMLEWDSAGTRFIVMMLVVVTGYIAFEKSKLGKQCKAIGSNIEVARQSGVNIDKIKITGFMITGALAGLVAFFSLIRSATASSSTGAGYEINALNALLIGGMPFSGGTSSRFQSVIIGSIIVAVISSGMTMWGLGITAQQVVRGIIFLIAISLTLDRKSLSVIK